MFFQKRTSLLITILLVLLLALVACGGGEDAPAEEAEAPAEIPEEGPAAGELEVFSWWTSGG